LELVIAQFGLEIAIAIGRAQLRRQRIEHRLITRRQQVRIVGHLGRDECARAGINRFALDEVRPATFDLDLVAMVVRGVPTQLAGLGRMRMLRVEPRGPTLEYPQALGLGGGDCRPRPPGSAGPRWWCDSTR